MINLTDRKCPACQENLDSKPSVLPDINPEDNIDIIKNYWRGTYKQKNFFPYHRCKYGKKNNILLKIQWKKN